MARTKKSGERKNFRLSQDVVDMLEEYCAHHKFDMTYAIENLVRLHVPLMMARLKKPKLDQTEQPSSHS